ncbi:DoxX family protein [Pendulispora albinea]|uniref:DoxX family protein n=1 Tax=Pendulispora albinea TaxID=2741071 RepID=A0ABZ2LUI0_9BACT
MRQLALFFRPAATPSQARIALRAAVGGVFLVSGIIKLLYENQGVGRFTRIGLPLAAQLARFVSVVEIVAGGLLLVGLFTRLATVPLMVDMLVAIVTTKVPLLFGVGPEPVSAMPKIGFWAFAYQVRLDITMLCACGYLLAVGAGLWSFDALLMRRRWSTSLLGQVHHDTEVGPHTVA